jgi:zinc-finger of transposase IS204/IS1001/IS1096/IS1165
MIIFPDILDVEAERVEITEEITLTLRTVAPTALCPSCGTASLRIQSRYTRTLRDLPSVGRPLRLIMHVRHSDHLLCRSISPMTLLTVSLLTRCHRALLRKFVTSL